MIREYSCGAVIFKRKGDEIRYLVIQHLDGHHGFPKGHMEPGETRLDTAKREIREEVGLEPTFVDGFSAKETYVLPNKQDVEKQVVYFLAESGNEPIRVQPEEVLNAHMLTFEEALEMLEHPQSREILAQANRYLQNGQKRESEKELWKRN